MAANIQAKIKAMRIVVMFERFPSARAAVDLAPCAVEAFSPTARCNA
jgi:hypothetical protein